MQPISEGNHEALCSFLIVRNVRTSNEIQERCNGSRVSSVDCIHFCISRYLTTSHERIGISVPRFVVWNACCGTDERNLFSQTMNKYIQDYISKKKKENKEDEKMSLAEVLNKLQIGKKEYLGDCDGAPTMDFPFFDMEKNDYYRYNVGEVSDEEYEELLKYVPDEVNPNGTNKGKMSFWYWCAIILMAVGIIGGIVVASERHGEAAGIGIIIGSMVFFSQIILLSRIEYNTRKNK